MKTISKIKADYSSEYKYFGIVSKSKDFKVCYDINLEMDIKMIRKEDMILQGEKKIPSNQLFISEKEGHSACSEHSLYHCYDEIRKCDFYLLSNYGTHGILLPEFKQCNFIFMVSNEAVDDDLTNLYQEQLNKAESIETAFKIEEKQIKSISNIII